MVARRIRSEKCVLLLAAVAIGCCLMVGSPSQATKFTVCDQDKSSARVSNVVVSDCEKLDDTCPFVRGFNKSIELDFTPKQRIEKVTVKVAGKLNKLPVPFHVSPDLACGNYGFECPLQADQAYKFKLTLPILRTYPKINVDVFVRLLDERGQLVGCVELPARIQEPAKEAAGPAEVAPPA